MARLGKQGLAIHAFNYVWRKKSANGRDVTIMAPQH